MTLTIAKAAQEDVYRDIARVPEQHRLDSSGLVIPEGSVCRVSIRAKSTFVIVRGADSTRDTLSLDERTRNHLRVNVGETAEVQFEAVGVLGQIRWAWQASDPAYQITARLAVLSVVLGGIGFPLGLLALFQ